jgi:hypothetical protein
MKQAQKSHEMELPRLIMTVDTPQRDAEGQRRMLAIMELGKEPNDVTGDGNKERAAGRWRCD